MLVLQIIILRKSTGMIWMMKMTVFYIVSQYQLGHVHLLISDVGSAGFNAESISGIVVFGYVK